MGQKRKYFVLNKALDFQRCLLQHMFYEQGRLQTDSEAGVYGCALISRVFDSGEADMLWHRFVCEMENEGNPAFTVSIYAANSLTRQLDGKDETIEHILFDDSLPLSEKKQLLSPYFQKAETNMTDMLLHDIKGRYLWFILDATLQEGQRLAIEKIKLFFPAESWLSYLPEIYERSDKDQFFERFLAIFQTMYETLNDAIYSFPYMIDIDCAGKDYLEWLAGWLDIADSYMWTEDQLRRLLKNAVTLYRMRGTRAAVLEFVKLYTGDERVYLVENFQVRKHMTEEDSRLLTQLYGDDPYKFQILVSGDRVPTAREYQTLTKIIKEVKPAHMEAELIVLKPFIFLGSHTYLGLNSILGEYRRLSLDGASMLPFFVLGEEEKQ